MGNLNSGLKKDGKQGLIANDLAAFAINILSIMYYLIVVQYSFADPKLSN